MRSRLSLNNFDDLRGDRKYTQMTQHNNCKSKIPEFHILEFRIILTPFFNQTEAHES